MKHIKGWLILVIGLILAINASGMYAIPYTDWLVAILVIVIGILKITKKK